jgi:NAD/NADP transhydrogenase alpha subunit
MTKMTRAYLAVLLTALISVTNFSGCVAVVAGGAAAGTLFVTGDLKSTLETSPSKTRKAIESAAKSLQLIQITAEGDELGGKYVYRMADDTKVSIRYRSTTDTTTDISIRVGTFGDEALSTKILKKINQAL